MYTTSVSVPLGQAYVDIAGSFPPAYDAGVLATSWDSNSWWVPTATKLATGFRIYFNAAPVLTGQTVTYFVSEVGLALSDVDIANRALVQIGGNTITSLADTTPEAVVVAAWYATARDEVIVAHPWNFALTRATLAQIVSPGVNWDYAFAYQLPTDCLRVLETSWDDEESPWVVEGRKLWISEGSVSIKYLASVTDPSQFSKGFEQAFTYKLAAQIAYPIRRDRQLVVDMEALYQDALKKAKAWDGQEQSPRTLRVETLKVVR